MHTLKMDTSHISKKLLYDHFYLRSVTSGKSSVWNKFDIVTDIEKKDLDFIAACMKCYHVLTYKGRSTSTN